MTVKSLEIGKLYRTSWPVWNGKNNIVGKRFCLKNPQDKIDIIKELNQEYFEVPYGSVVMFLNQPKKEEIVFLWEETLVSAHWTNIACVLDYFDELKEDEVSQ